MVKDVCVYVLYIWCKSAASFTGSGHCHCVILFQMCIHYVSRLL